MKFKEAIFFLPQMCEGKIFFSKSLFFHISDQCELFECVGTIKCFVKENQNLEIHILKDKKNSHTYTNNFTKKKIIFWEFSYEIFVSFIWEEMRCNSDHHVIFLLISMSSVHVQFSLKTYQR